MRVRVCVVVCGCVVTERRATAADCLRHPWLAELAPLGEVIPGLTPDAGTPRADDDDDDEEEEEESESAAVIRSRREELAAMAAEVERSFQRALALKAGKAGGGGGAAAGSQGDRPQQQQRPRRGAGDADLDVLDTEAVYNDAHANQVRLCGWMVGRGCTEGAREGMAAVGTRVSNGCVRTRVCSSQGGYGLPISRCGLPCCELGLRR